MTDLSPTSPQLNDTVKKAGHESLLAISFTLVGMGRERVISLLGLRQVS